MLLINAIEYRNRVYHTLWYQMYQYNVFGGVHLELLAKYAILLQIATIFTTDVSTHDSANVDFCEFSVAQRLCLL